MEFGRCGKSDICLILKTKRLRYHGITVGKLEFLTQILIGIRQDDSIQSRNDNRSS